MLKCLTFLFKKFKTNFPLQLVVSLILRLQIFLLKVQRFYICLFDFVVSLVKLDGSSIVVKQLHLMKELFLKLGYILIFVVEPERYFLKIIKVRLNLTLKFISCFRHALISDNLFIFLRLLQLSNSTMVVRQLVFLFFQLRFLL